MKKHILSILLFLLFICQALAADGNPKDPGQTFYRANALYEKGDYANAVEGYKSLLDSGIESGNLYYNIGNAFFKLGKLGYAILNYERARRLIPQDSDLKANLDYARSLAGDEARQKNPIFRIIKLPFRYLSMNNLTLTVCAIYLLTILLLVVSILNRLLAKRIRFLTIFFSGIFVFALAAFAIRYYEEEVLKYGVIVEKEVECKYEPIDKSTTYYSLGEGSKIIILKVRNDWCQIKRLDGKIAWVKRVAVEKI